MARNRLPVRLPTSGLLCAGTLALSLGGCASLDLEATNDTDTRAWGATAVAADAALRPWSAEVDTGRTKLATAADPSESASRTWITTGTAAPRARGQRVIEEKVVADASGTARWRATNTKAEPQIALPDAVERALAENPLVRLQKARADEAGAAIAGAEAALYPHLDVTSGAGGGVIGTYKTTTAGIDRWSNRNRYYTGREETMASARQFIFDFGATQALIRRAKSGHEAEILKVYDQAEDVTHQVVQSYLKVIEQRELKREATENVASVDRIFAMVDANQQGGNNTLADLKRVRSRLLEAQANFSDIESELRNASDRFERLTKIPTQTLASVPSLRHHLPPNVEAATELMNSNHPRIAALNAEVRMAAAEKKSKSVAGSPLIQMEMDATGKAYNYYNDTTDVDVRTMLTARYKVFDGGARASEFDQAGARMAQSEMRVLAEKEDVEASLRQAYQALNAARDKQKRLLTAAEDAAKALQLYNQQYAEGGNRRLLELLDVQSAYYAARRNEITNRFDELRASAQILRAVGNLTATVTGAN